MQKISTSILSCNNLEEDLIKLNETSTDYIHLDVMDGEFVNNKTLPFSKMKNIYKFTSKRLDVHLMVSHPEELIRNYATLNSEYITIHCEIDDDIDSLLELIESFGIKKGLAINPETPLNKVLPYINKVDLILVMSVHPGAGGQSFIEDTTSRINTLKDFIKDNNLNVLINVDGGINDKTINKVSNSDIVVSGSYIVCSDNFEERINILRGI